MKVVIGADHKGFELKKFFINQVLPKNIEWIDEGCFDSQSCDYPFFANLVVKSILQKNANLGILICGTGIGMSIAANRHKGIYAALCWNEKIATLSRKHNNSNILVLPAEYVSKDQARKIFLAWSLTSFDEIERYKDRLKSID